MILSSVMALPLTTVLRTRRILVTGFFAVTVAAFQRKHCEGSIDIDCFSDVSGHVSCCRASEGLQLDGSALGLNGKIPVLRNDACKLPGDSAFT